jgi:hypothetical protein
MAAHSKLNPGIKETPKKTTFGLEKSRIRFPSPAGGI